MHSKRSGRKPVFGSEVRAQRRRVWVRRAVTLAVVIAAFVSWRLYLDRRFAAHRDPAVALAAGSQVFDDAQAALQQTDLQLALALTMMDDPKHGLPGPVAPNRILLRNWYRSTFAYFRRYGDHGHSAVVSRTGAPVLIAPQAAEITGYLLDRRGRVAEITLKYTYGLCWDETATTGAVVPRGDPFPPRTAALRKQKARYTEAYEVVDVLIMHFDGSAGQWRPSKVQRLTAQLYD